MNAPALEPAVCYTVWDGDDLRRAIAPDVERDLAEARPQVVILHAGPDRLLAAAPQLAHHVRDLVPGIRLWLGIGLDYWTGRAMAGDTAGAIKHALDAVDLAAQLGCEAVDWDPELEADEQVEHAVAVELLARARAAHPDLVQVHTAFDHPTLHGDALADGRARKSGYPWQGWLGADSPVAIDLPQVYPALEHAVGRGVLQAREASSRASYAVAVQHAWVRPELVGPGIYLQLHGVPSLDTTQVGARYRYCAGWVSALMDDDGRRSLRELCEFKRRGATSVEDFQRAAGLNPDGACGRDTRAALGLLPAP